MRGIEVATVGAADGARGQALRKMFARYGLAVEWCEPRASIPGSYWGEPEAGLVGHTLYVRADTPIHSALHEGCHYVCADDARRATLDTDAAGDDLEECAVCYLSIVFAESITDFNRERMLEDMDRWGYSFRLGSAKQWYHDDAADAREWLERRGLTGS